jgi:translocation and assembly module TamB
VNLRNLTLPKPVRWLIRGAGVILVLCALIIAVASTGWFRDILQHRVEASLAQATGGKVEIAGMEFHPLKLRVNVRRLVVHGLEKDGEKPLFSARDVMVSISPQSLVQLRLLLRTLQWQSAEIFVRTYPGGSTNLPGTTVAPRRGNGLADLLNMGIERLTLSNTTLHWNDQRVPLQVFGSNVAIQLHISKEHHYLGSVASSDAVLNWKDRTTPHLSFATSFELSDHQVRVSGLSWQIENLRGHLAGVLKWKPRLAANFEFRTNGGLQRLARTLKIAPVERGYLYVDGKGAYGPKGFSVKGRLRARDLNLKTAEVKPGVLSLTTDYELAGNSLRFPNFTLAGNNTRAQGDATVSLAKPRPRVVLNAQFKGLNLSGLMGAMPGINRAIGILHPQSVLSGVLNATWQLHSQLQAQFDLQFDPPEEPAPQGLPLNGHAQGELVLGTKDSLTLSDARISTPHSTMTSHGTFGFAGSLMTVRFDTSDFEEWRPVAEVLIETRNPMPVTLHSQGVFAGRVSGTFSNPDIAGKVSSGTFNYGGWAWDSFQAGIMISPERARIQSGRLRLGKSSLTVDADVGLVGWKLEPYSSVRLHATAQDSPVAGVRAALNLKPSMEGLVSGRVQAEGTVESLSGRGQVSVRNGELAGVPFESVSANILATRSNWEIRDLRFVEDHGSAEGSLQVNPVKRTFSASVHGRNFQLNRIHFLNPQLTRSKVTTEVSGLVNFDLEGKGTFDNAQLHAAVDITELAWKGQSLGSVHGDVAWQGREIKLQIKGGGGEAGNFQMAGNLETVNNWPIQLSGQYSSLRLDPWIAEFSGHSMAAEISASGSFAMEGPLRDKKLLSANSRIQQLEINFPALQLANEEPVEVSYANSSLKLKQFRLQGQATNFEVGGSIHFGQSPTVDITAQGKAAATLLGLAASGVKATGESNLQVQMRGSLREPQLSGEIQVKDVGLGYTGLPFRLNALNGTIKLEGERAVISSLKGTIGGGSVNLTGFLVLQDTARYQLRADLSQVRIRYPTDFTSVLDGRLVLAGTSSQGQLNGNIAVRNLFANESLNLVSLLSGPSVFGGPSVSHPSSFASRVSLNVSLASARPVRIETHDLRLVADIEMQLQGTLANPVAVGNIYLRSGDAIFRGNRYTLTRGDISMTNPFRTEPVLDLQVRTRVEKYDLTLEISGPTDQIRFSYRSDPPLPTQDILSLLAFGYSKRLEEFAPEATNPFSSASASALLSQALSSQVTGRIQRLFGVSRVKFSPSSTELGALGGPVLTVEQQLSPALTLTYETSTANSQYRVVEFEFTVNPRMSVRGFRDQNGIFGLELKFRKRFK